VRNGLLGALHAPAPGDSIRWRFHDRDEGMLLAQGAHRFRALSAKGEVAEASIRVER
jgi:hypothetical protein